MVINMSWFFWGKTQILEFSISYIPNIFIAIRCVQQRDQHTEEKYAPQSATVDFLGKCLCHIQWQLMTIMSMQQYAIPSLYRQQAADNSNKKGTKAIRHAYGDMYRQDSIARVACVDINGFSANDRNNTCCVPTQRDMLIRT